MHSLEFLHMLLGFFFGALMIACAYGFVVGAVLRDRLYLYHSGFVASLILFFLGHSGLAAQWVSTENMLWPLRELDATGALVIFFYVAFIRRLLKTSKETPRLDRVLLIINVVSLVRGVASLIVYPHFALHRIAEIVTLALMGTSLTIAIRMISRSVVARIFLVSVLAFDFPVIVFLFKTRDTGVHWFFEVAPYVGTVLQVLFLAIAHSGWVLKLNTQLKHSNRELEREISERKKAEAELQAQQVAMLQAEKLKALGRMAGGLAHEISNPLAIIQGRASQLQSMVSTGEINPIQVAHLAERIEVTTARISRVIRALKTFVRDSGADPLTPVPLASVVTNAVDLCQERFRGEGVRLEIAWIDPSVYVRCRPADMMQVILNLLENSLFAVIPLSERWVKIESVRSGERISLKITDSGPGIAAYLRDKILEPFFTTKAVGMGTGLGLSVSRAVVENLGGNLRLDSTCERTCFIIELPFFEAKKQTSHLQPVVSEGPSRFFRA